MDKMYRKDNKCKIQLGQFINPPTCRKQPDSVGIVKLRNQSRGIRQKYLLFLSVFLVVLTIGIVLIVKGCSGSKTDPLYGKWDVDGTTVYVFDGKGGGALELPLNKYEFQYEIKDGAVNIDFADDKVRDISYEFAVDSDELTLERKEKKDTITYKLQKQTDNQSK